MHHLWLVSNLLLLSKKLLSYICSGWFVWNKYLLNCKLEWFFTLINYGFVNRYLTSVLNTLSCSNYAISYFSIFTSAYLAYFWLLPLAVLSNNHSHRYLISIITAYSCRLFTYSSSSLSIILIYSQVPLEELFMVLLMIIYSYSSKTMISINHI